VALSEWDNVPPNMERGKRTGLQKYEDGQEI
jgi:hypothetical protein